MRRDTLEAVRRRQLVEIEDLAWCPRAVRDGGTDWLGFMANKTGIFAAVAPKIRDAMQVAGTEAVLDLCSGGGGPWLTLQPELAKSGAISVTLSDLYPNIDAFAALHARSHGQLQVHATGMNATNVPVELSGVRTMFNAFHHFTPDVARAILADAVAKNCPIAIFEGVNHRGLIAAMPLQLPAMLLLTPFIRPLRASRLFFTYVVPLIPLMVLVDGTVSLLRLYLVDELHELVLTVPGHERFQWDIGITKTFGPFGPMHLIGVPKTNRGV